jgi:hypothetical protein
MAPHVMQGAAHGEWAFRRTGVAALVGFAVAPGLARIQLRTASNINESTLNSPLIESFRCSRAMLALRMPVNP